MSAEPPFGGGDFIADKSVWARADREQIRDEWAAALAGGQIFTCHATSLELLYSARTAEEFETLQEELGALRLVAVTQTVCEAAIWAMGELVTHSGGYHRIPIPDYLIAACAQDAGVGVLHYDQDFDRLAQVLEFESRWVAPRGSLD
jgi:predicted nucleic acid-binding protein